jgi:plastocyanin
MKLAPLLSFLLVALAASAANAEDLTVGEWIIPADGGPYPSMEANVGDTITFVWPATHSVQINPSGSCDFEGTVMIGDTSPTAYTFVEADGSPEGTPHLFVCGVGAGAHCEAGKKHN